MLDKKNVFNEEQYLQIWDMIFSQTGYPAGHPKNKTAVSEPKKFKIGAFGVFDMKDDKCGDYGFYSTQIIPREKFPAIQKAIESALNDTVVEDRFDGKRANFYAMDEVGQWDAAYKEMTKEKMDELMKKLYDQPLQFYSQPKRYSQSEVDAIRKETFIACREKKSVGGCALYKYFNYDSYLSSLNLNTKDTDSDDIDSMIKTIEIFKQKTVNDNAFVFTDELWKEYVDFVSRWDYQKSETRNPFEDFKLSKQSAPVDTGKGDFIEISFRRFFKGKALPVNQFMLIPAEIFEETKQAIGAVFKKHYPAPEPSALPTKEYEILSFKTEGHIWTKQEGIDYYKANATGYPMKVFIKDGDAIHSVRRLSDNTVWQVGDKVEYGAISMEIAALMKLKETTIASFKINEGSIWAYGDNFFIAPLNHLRKPSNEKLPITDHPTQPVVEDKPVVIDEDAFKNRCNVCGSDLVYIRGKYPNTDKRPTCPTCTTERLEQINEISSKDYGKAYQSN